VEKSLGELMPDGLTRTVAVRGSKQFETRAHDWGQANETSWI
jgi:hypothetical protein